MMKMDESIQNNKKIRVLQVTDKCAVRGSPIHGLTRLLLNWVPEFKKTNVDMLLCVLRTDEGCGDFLSLGVPRTVLDRGKLDPRTILDLIRVIKKEKIQILHCHGYGSSTFGRIAGFVTRTPVIIHEHMIDPDIPLYQKVSDKLLFPFTGKGIAVSAAVKDFMTGVRSVPERKVQVVHNCVPSYFFKRYTDEQKKDFVKKYNIPQGKYIVGIVGRLDALKAHCDFLRAAERVLKAVPETVFIIVGEGELRIELEALARQLGIENNVLFLGHCDTVKELVCLFDVFALSSLTEGFAISIIEAMAQSKPVVATAVGGIPEVISDGKNGYLVPVSSPAELAEKIVVLLGNEDLRRRFGEEGFEHSRRYFHSEVAVKKLCELYSELI